MTSERAYYLLLLGSNIDPKRNLPLARTRLHEDWHLAAQSDVYESEPVGASGSPRFQNQALLLKCSLEPCELRSYLRRVERDQGRVRTSDRNAPRSIDIDRILALDSDRAVLSDPKPDAELGSLHHICLPTLQVLGNVTIPGFDRSLGQLAHDMGPPPDGFVVRSEGNPGTDLVSSG